MATERIQIIVSSKGTVSVKRDIESISENSRRAANGVDLLKRALGALTVTFGIGQLIEVADQYQVLQNRLRLVTDGTDQLALANQRLYAISRETYSSFDSTATLYQKVALAFREMGGSAEDAIKFTKSFQQAAILSGSSLETTAQAVYQFTQALNKGKLDGDEFKSVMEGLPYVAQILTQELGVTKRELYAMSEAGELSVDAMLTAFMRAKDAIAGDFGTVIPTVRMALQQLYDSWLLTVGAIQDGTGVFSSLAYAIIFVADNLNTFLLLLTPLGVALTWLAGRAAVGAVVFAFQNMAAVLTSAVIPALVRFTALLWANPYVIAIAGISTILAYFIDWEKSINALIKAWAIFTYYWHQFWGNEAGMKRSIEIGINADEAVDQLKTAGVDMKNAVMDGFGGGTDYAAPKIYNALAKGGDAVAGKLAGAMNDGFKMTDDLAKSIYENLNGKVIKPLGQTLLEGGEYFYNEATGAITKATDQGATTMQTSIVDGGETAGDTLYKSMTSAAASAGNSLYQQLATLGDVWSNSAQKFIGDLIVEQLRAQQRMMLEETRLLQAERNALNRANSPGFKDIDKSGRDDDRNMRYGGFSSPSAGGGVADEHGMSPYRGTWQPQFTANRGDRQTTTKTVTTTTETGRSGDNGAPKITVPVDVTNVFDPNMVPLAMGTAKGQRAVVNAIAASREEIQAILGVA